MQVLFIVLMFVLIIIISACNYTYNPNIGEGIMIRFMSTLCLLMCSLFCFGYTRITPTQTTQEIIRDIAVCKAATVPTPTCNNGYITIEVK